MTSLQRHRFWDTIMATRFSVMIEAPTGEADRVHALAEEVFEEIRRLESLFSRFIEDSEISQINRLRLGESVRISPETHRCLGMALKAKRLTRGYFDVAYRSEGVKESQEAFLLLSKPARVRSESDSLQLDLGGIGKGFALDWSRDILIQYGYDRALLCADTSTILALKPPRDDDRGWPVVVETRQGDQEIFLANESISCSGTSVRRAHIFDTRQRIYKTVHDRCYVRTPSPTLADAFSTALLVSGEMDWNAEEPDE